MLSSSSFQHRKILNKKHFFVTPSNLNKFGFSLPKFYSNVATATHKSSREEGEGKGRWLKAKNRN